MCMGQNRKPPKIVMPPAPPPPAMRDMPEFAEAELEMAVKETQKGAKREYRKVVASTGKSESSSTYAGGGLQTT